MGTNTEVFGRQRTGNAILRAAAVGVLAGLTFGLLIQFRLNRMTAIGAMYTIGEPSLSIGWIAHLLHSLLFGGVYGLLVDRPLFDEYARDPVPGVSLGLGYGALLWAVNIVFLWPLWLNWVGLPAAPPFPYVAAMPLAGHLVYGGLLGGLFGLVVD